MKIQGILAVVVSFNGAETLQKTVSALLGAVEHIVIVDNGSDPTTTQLIDLLSQESKVSAIKLKVNKGIGYALNLGVKEARARGYQWLLTMDQDSTIDPAMIESYRAALETQREYCCLTPELAKPSEKSNAPSVREVKYAISSGNLVHISVFDNAGLYDEGFFVDCVDFDFSLRARLAGYRIFRVSSAFMSHQLGEQSKDIGSLRQFYARHSPVRRYYMYRNYMYLLERHILRFPGFILKLGLLQLLLLILIGIHDQNPRESYRAIFLGLKDYFARKVGGISGLST